MAKRLPYKWQVLIVVMLGTFMAALDASIVNVSIPAIMAEFGASVDRVEWVITAYMLAFATFMPLTSWLSARWGHKFLFSTSLAVFTAGSFLCAVAWSLPVLIAARTLQALGGGAITPVSMAMIAESFAPEELGRAMGVWGVGVILGPAFGPTIGGFLTQEFGWRSIFLVNIPLGALGLLLAIQIIRSDRPSRTTLRVPFDFWGFLFLSMFLIGLLLGLSRGEQDGWTSIYILSEFAISAIGFVGFLTVESLITGGIVDLSLFTQKIFVLAFIITLMRSIVLFGGNFLLPLFLERVKNLDEMRTGLILLPGVLLMAALRPLSGWLTERVGSRWLALIGVFGLTLFMFMYRKLAIQMSTWDVIEPTLVRGAAAGFIMTPVMTTALNSLPTAKAGMVSSMINLAQQVGGAFGIALLSTAYTGRVKYHLSEIGSAINPSSSEIQMAIRHLTRHAIELGHSAVSSAHIATAQVQMDIWRHVSVRAYRDSFLLGAMLAIICVVPVLFLPKTPIIKRRGQ